jgi:C1A family cysteine protease
LVEDQSDLGSCSGNAVVSAYELLLKQLYPESWTNLSRLFVYYNARIYEGTVDEDSGATIRNSLKGLAKYGVCKESIWPYDISKYAIVPSSDAYSDGLPRAITRYERTTSTDAILDAINTNYPVVIGTLIYGSFFDLDSNNAVMSKQGPTDYVVGGHALTLVGYDLEQQQYLVENSFGSEWGIGGYCWMPFSYADQNLLESWVYYIPAPSATTLVD